MKKLTMKKLMTAMVLGLLGTAAFALEVSGVKLDDQATVAGKTLVLNGGGLRSEFGFVSVYVAGLYLPAKSADAAAIINLQAPRRVVMVMKRGVGAGRMLKAFHKGIQQNLSDAELAALTPQLNELDQSMREIKEVHENDVITLDIDAGGGLQLAVNGQNKATIAGPGIGPAMLKIWLGEAPVQDDLKKALLGK
jgi:hypothetical protein